jgi:hypothetical protein
MLRDFGLIRMLFKQRSRREYLYECNFNVFYLINSIYCFLFNQYNFKFYYFKFFLIPADYFKFFVFCLLFSGSMCV